MFHSPATADGGVGFHVCLLYIQPQQSQCAASLSYDFAESEGLSRTCADCSSATLCEEVRQNLMLI